MFGGIDVAATQVRHQQLVAAEDVQRQEAPAGAGASPFRAAPFLSGVGRSDERLQI